MTTSDLAATEPQVHFESIGPNGRDIKDMGQRLVAVIRRPHRGEPSRNYVGLPPMESGEADTRTRMPLARVLVVETRPDGTFLDRYDDTGAGAGDTWHMSIEDAKEQAGLEYGADLSSWTEVPESESDAVAFAFRIIEINRA